MAKDKTNQTQEPISVRRQRGGKVGMGLPRQDDGMVHKATGRRTNTSAAHFADAMDKVAGGPSGAQRPVSGG